MVHVFVDPKTMEKQEIPADVRERLSRYVCLKWRLRAAQPPPWARGA